MSLAALCLVCLGHGAAGSELRPAPGVPQDWQGVWTRLRELEALPGAAPRAGSLAAELEETAAAAGDDPRGALLRARLVRRHEPGHRIPAPLAAAWVGEWPFEGQATWLALEVLAPGELRVEGVLAGLAATPELASGEVRLAWEVAVAELGDLRFDGALAVLEELHARYGAAWSAIDLSLALATAGRVEASDRVLADQIARETAAGRPTAELWSRRGIAAWGSGDDGRGRDYLGQALARGSADAAVVLARLDLAAGRMPAARAGFRALLLDGEPGAWALRGWGLSLLEPLTASTERSTSKDRP